MGWMGDISQAAPIFTTTGSFETYGNLIGQRHESWKQDILSGWSSARELLAAVKRKDHKLYYFQDNPISLPSFPLIRFKKKQQREDGGEMDILLPGNRESKEYWSCREHLF